jgi:hypothetical protein
MNKFINILCLAFVLSVAAFAQTNPDEYKKNEYYAGYSNQQIDNGNYRTANGAEFSYVRNVHRYFGIKGDVSGAFRNDSFTFNGVTGTVPSQTYTAIQKANRSVYNFLVGVQVKNNTSNARFKPFAHGLVGAAVTREKYNYTCTQGSCPVFFNAEQGFVNTNTHLAFAVGGGIDIKINDKIDFRAIQIDYNPIQRGGGNFQQNVRFGVGIVFK